MHLAGERGADRARDLLGLSVLEDVAGRTGLERGGDLLLLDERGHRHDLGLGSLGLDAADRRDAIHVRHQEIHQHDVGLEAAGHRDAFGAVGGLADHLDVRLEVEEHLESHPDDRVVVDDQDADRRGFGHVGSWRGIGAGRGSREGIARGRGRV